MKNLMKSIVYGKAIGDALGVPVEFIERVILRQKPITKMIGYGTHDQLAGTWSDDTSLLLAIIDGVKDGYDINKIADNFYKWRYYAHFTAYGEVFDCGTTTLQAIQNIADGKPPLECGLNNERSQGNGSLMRTLALVPLVKGLPIEERYRIVTEVSQITHAHLNCTFSCFFLVEFALMLIEMKDKIKFGVISLTALILTQDLIKKFIQDNNISMSELSAFERIFGPIEKEFEDKINSNGYVISTLEASIWCIVKTNNYHDAVLAAVNLGYDTDTTGAVTGGLAGILYGFDGIPKDWVDLIANKNLLNETIGID